MKKKAIFIPLLATLATIGLVSCGETENNNPDPVVDPIVDPIGGGGNTEEEDDTIDWEAEKLGDKAVDPTNDNARVYYEIMPISFADSNGDGNGDFQGIINRLDYLNDGDVNSGKSLGVQGIWLTPIHPSPSYHKYDVNDYYKVDSTFGTMDDYVNLLNACHERNVNVLMDLVINHTSKYHNWYSKFVKAHQDGDTESEFYDFYSYVERGEQESGKYYTPIPNTTQVVECNFGDSMPELNYDNDAVYDEMLNVAKFWIDKGVDGFRFDAAKYIYYNDVDRTCAFWDKYIADIKEYGLTLGKDIFTVAEVYDSSLSNLAPYNTSVNTFDFGCAQTTGAIYESVKNGNAGLYTNHALTYINKVKEMNPESMFVPFFSNHDMDRSAGYFLLKTQSKMAANLYLLSPGAPFIYYGEEIGIKGSRAAGVQTDADRRVHMRWGNYNDINDECNDPVGTTYEEKKQTNGTVASQINSKSSLLTHYRHLIQIRTKYPAIRLGNYTALTAGNAAGFNVEYNDTKLGILHNCSDKDVVVDLSTIGYTKLLEYIGANKATINGTKVTIQAKTSIIVG